MKRINLYINEDILSKLNELSVNSGRKSSELIREAIIKLLLEYEKYKK